MNILSVQFEIPPILKHEAISCENHSSTHPVVLSLITNESEINESETWKKNNSNIFRDA